MKKYTERFIDEISKLKFARVGMEFEFYLTDLSYYKTLEILNQYLAPVKVWGFRQYHSDFKPDAGNFKIEPDLSGGSNMVELVTGPMNYFEAKHYLVKLIKFIQDYGYTNEKASIHFNLSFNGDKNLNDLNVLKLILNTNEEEIYSFYPSRKGNIYAKSVKNIIPFKEYDFFNISIESVKNSLYVPEDKYYGINFTHINSSKEKQRLEYRYIGGEDYEKSIGNIVYFLDRFIIDSYNSIDIGFNQNDCDNLEIYLEKNIEKYKSFSKYDNFLIEYPNIQLQVDQNNMYELVSSYFLRIYDRLWDVIESTDGLKDCILNYVTATQKLEIIDATVKGIFPINSIEFVNCILLEGIFEKCNFYGCEITKSDISKSKIEASEIKSSKVLSCRVENTTLTDCFFMSGFLNGDMNGGIFRSGELGPYASISPETKVVDRYDNFFDTKFETDEKSDTKGKIVGFKK
jgi:hypothetical protein